MSTLVVRFGAAVLVTLTLQARVPQPAADLAIEHVAVIDGIHDIVVSDQTVVTADGRIVSVGPSAAAAVPASSLRVDGRGKFLIPGLWDMHVHLTQTTDLACPVLIANGVTSVRDMGGELELIDWMRDRIGRGALTGPTIYRAGPFVDGSKPAVADRLVVATAEDGRAAARLLKNRGVDHIKTHTTTPRDAYFGLAEEARLLSLPLVGHVPFEVTPEEAVNAGQQTIEHVVSLFEGPLGKLVRETGLRQDAALARFGDEYFSQLADRMVAHHTWFDPTLITYWTRSNQWDLAADPRNRYVAASGREYWKVFADLPNTPEMRSLQARAYARLVEIVRIAASRGVRIVTGTDLTFKYLAPGFSLHDELRRLVDAGLTPVQALQAATRNSAEAAGALKDAGTIEAGKRADLVLLDADPIAAIANTAKISIVVVNGRLLDRAALDRLLANAEAEAPRR